MQTTTEKFIRYFWRQVIYALIIVISKLLGVINSVIRQNRTGWNAIGEIKRIHQIM